MLMMNLFSNLLLKNKPPVSFVGLAEVLGSDISLNPSTISLTISISVILVRESEVPVAAFWDSFLGNLDDDLVLCGVWQFPIFLIGSASLDTSSLILGSLHGILEWFNLVGALRKTLNGFKLLWYFSFS